MIEERQQAVELIPGQTALRPVKGAGLDLVSARTIQEVTTMTVEEFRKFLPR
jgi:hypothetical protein